MQVIQKLNKTEQSIEGHSVKDFNVSFIPNKHGIYRIEIDDVITDVSQFSTAIQVLEMATEDDAIQIMLQSDGGNVDAGDAFLHAMANCEAHIHVTATGGCHSLATHILLQADSFSLSEGFLALCHNGSGGAVGNINEYMAKSIFDAEFRTRRFKSVYEGFLTEEEIDNMLKGQDIWLDAEAWCKRQEKRNEYFKNKFLAMEQELAESSSFKQDKKKPRKPKTLKAPAA